MHIGINQIMYALLKAVMGKTLNPLQPKFEMNFLSGKRNMQSSYSQESRFVFNYSCLFACDVEILNSKTTCVLLWK